MQCNRVVKYEVDGKQFNTVREAREHVDSMIAEILLSVCRIHEGRHTNSIKAVESVTESGAVRSRLGRLLLCSFNCDTEAYEED